VFAGFVTIVPRHFVNMPSQFPGTKALDLINPEVTQEVGLVWSPSEPMMPMARVLVSIVNQLQESGELKKRLSELSGKTS